VRIGIRPSARAHLILDTEIRALVIFPALRLSLEARRPGAQPVLFIGPAVTNEPWIEVIADLANPPMADVFHAMMLRRSLVESLGLDDLIDPEYGPQRA
jgi:hypothetical protein